MENERERAEYRIDSTLYIMGEQDQLEGRTLMAELRRQQLRPADPSAADRAQL
jgi:hypothetical protein